LRFQYVVSSAIERERPSTVLIQEDGTKFGQIVAREARSQEVACLAVFGNIPAYDPFGNIFGRVPHVASACAVTGPLLKTNRNGFGAFDENSVVTGNRFSPVDNHGMQREEIYAKLHIEKTKRLFVFSSQPFPESDKIHNVLIAMMKHFPEKHLVISLHPLESYWRSRGAARRAELRNVTITKRFKTIDLIAIADLVGTISSSTALDARILDKPVFILGLNQYIVDQPYFEPTVSPYVECGAAFGVYRYADLVPAIRSILQDTSAQERMARCRGQFVKMHSACNGKSVENNMSFEAALRGNV